MFKSCCLDFCPPHYYPSDNVCYGTILSISLSCSDIRSHPIIIECHETCEECFISGKSGCLTCATGLLLWRNQCLTACPDTTYQEGAKCISCHSPCGNCESATDCITCIEDFYKVLNSTKCTTAEKCPFSTYANKKTKYCEKCNPACLTCIGPKEDDCILCDINNGKLKYREGVGKCLSIVCERSQYLKIDYATSVAHCLPCHQSCESCSGPSVGECIECKAGLLPAQSTISKNRLYCRVCAEIGMQASANGNCEGILLINLNQNINNNQHRNLRRWNLHGKS